MLLNTGRFSRLQRPSTVTAVLAAFLFAPTAFAQQAAPVAIEKPPVFEVVAIKLTNPDSRGTNWNGTIDRITIQNYTLRHLIRVAYNLKSDTQVLGGPDWIGKQGFDVNAKLDDADVARLRDKSYEQRRHAVNLMLQSLLADRFQLKVSSSERTLPVYALVVARSGARLTALPDPKDDEEAKHRNHSQSTNNGHLTAKAISMDSFADYLTLQPEIGDRVVINRTGLSGDFNFTLSWTEDRGNGVSGDAALPGLFRALEEQMGLELKPDKGSVPVVSVEWVSRPELD